MLVSIVITTKNEEENIASCIESTKKQNYPEEKIEIIVVDNDSADNTKTIARKYTDKVFNHGPKDRLKRILEWKNQTGLTLSIWMQIWY